MWLDEDEGDGLIERELYEMVSLRQKKQKSEWTSLMLGLDVANTRTSLHVNINVCVTVIGRALVL